MDTDDDGVPKIVYCFDELDMAYMKKVAYHGDVSTHGVITRLNAVLYLYILQFICFYNIHALLERTMDISTTSRIEGIRVSARDEIDKESKQKHEEGVYK